MMDVIDSLGNHPQTPDPISWLADVIYGRDLRCWKYSSLMFVRWQDDGQEGEWKSVKHIVV